MTRLTARRALSTVLAAVSIAMFAGCGDSSRNDSVSYAAKDLVSGADVSIMSLRGQPALLVSWTTWCTECDEELSGLRDFAASDAADGIQIVAVNLDASDVTDEINAKVARHGLTLSLWRDKRNDFKRAFGALGVPTTVLIDANGAVVGLFPGAVDFDDRAILDALAEVRDASSP